MEGIAVDHGRTSAWGRLRRWILPGICFLTAGQFAARAGDIFPGTEVALGKNSRRRGRYRGQSCLFGRQQRQY